MGASFKSSERRRAIYRRHYWRNRAKRIAASARYRRTHPETVRLGLRRRSLKVFYGLTLNQYQVLLESQGFRCALCKRKPNKNKSLAVDHNHENGKIRGLLCNRCNSFLGFAQDSIKLLERAIKYLKI